jgi:hypothetical protein
VDIDDFHCSFVFVLLPPEEGAVVVNGLEDTTKRSGVSRTRVRGGDYGGKARPIGVRVDLRRRYVGMAQ